MFKPALKTTSNFISSPNAKFFVTLIEPESNAHALWCSSNDKAENAYTQRKKLDEKVHPWEPQVNQKPQESQEPQG